MGIESLPDHIRKDFEKAAQLGRNRKWKTAMATLAVLSLGAGALYAIEQHRRKTNLPEKSDSLVDNNPLTEFMNTAKKLRRAKADPSGVFFELPENSQMTDFIVAMAQTMTRQPRPLIATEYPIDRVREWRLRGGIGVLEVQYNVPAPDNSRIMTQHTSVAITGKDNSIKELHPLLPMREELVANIFRKFTHGEAALKANADERSQ